MAVYQYGKQLLSITQNKFSTRCLLKKQMSQHTSIRTHSAFIGMLKTKKIFKWTVVGSVVGGASYYGYRKYYDVKTTITPEWKQWKVKLYTLLPLNVVSMIWGKVNNIDLPKWMREPVYKLYIKKFNVNLDEAAIRDLTHYNNLGEFFRRRIRPNSRPVDKTNRLVSPCDGKVLHFGKVKDGWIEQVKGVSYNLPEFLGPHTWPSEGNGYTYTRLKVGAETGESHIPEKQYQNSIKNKKKTLYHCVIYLAPGDYHGFHSPAEWVVTLRRHFPGKLLSVNPYIAKRVRELFNLNERAVYIGEWEEGFMSMSAVGATNVGSMRVFFDEKLQTNQPFRYPKGTFMDEVFSRIDLGGIPMSKGEPFGEFNLGSTIVLIFEAPEHFQFKLQSGQIIKYGQPLGCYKNISRNTSGS